MFTIHPSTLRRVLWLDAAAGIGMALSHLAGASPIAEWTGIPAWVVLVAGSVVLAAASLAGWLASRPQLHLGRVRLLAAGNFAWVAASAWLAWGAGLALTPLGMGWVVVQGAMVLVLAELEWAGSSLPRPRPAV